jgi:hypothetical protein
MEHAPPRLPLDRWPLWRLIAELDDAERVLGPSSDTAKILARALRARLAGERRPAADVRKGVARAG